MRQFFAFIATLTLFVSAPLSGPARAATGTYWFHGNTTDQAEKQLALADDTAISGATFNTTPPAATDPVVTQTTTGAANQDYVGNPLTLYWHGHFNGSLVGQLQLDWWWTAPAPTALSITVFADPLYQTSRVQPDKVIGRGVVTIPGSVAPTESHSTIFVNGGVNSELLIQVAGASIITGNGPTVSYNSAAFPSNWTFVTMPVPVTPAVSFDATTTLAFAPSTTVSAHFLGGEPQTTLERRVAGSQSGRIDPNRIFVDWPLSSRSGTGQLSRSLDGGDSFRLLYDLTCAARSRPNCLTHGGGDTENDVNLITGDLFFGDQEVVLNEALSSSTDHGDTFPVDRQFPVSNAGSGVDRQWLAWIDPTIVKGAVRPIEAFYSYHVPALAVHVIGITTDGTPIDQPIPQITDVSQSGNLRVDNTNGPGRGWIYVPYRNGVGYQVASAPASDGSLPTYALPTSWKSNVITTDQPAIFPWLNLDARGNLYAVWVTSGVVYLSVSPIDDSRNKPGTGRPATYWTPKVRVSLPAVKSAVFPAVTAGDAGRIAIAYVGSEDCAPAATLSFASDNCQPAATWNTYAAVITNTLGLARAGSTTNIVSGKVSHRVIHHGSVCTSGTTCSGDRSLLDMIDLGFDQSGRVGVVFMDNNNGLAETMRTTPPDSGIGKDGPFTEFAKETAGPSLVGTSTVSVTIPENGRPDARGDATWPNTASGANLRSLDLLGAYVSTSGADLVARIPVADSSRAGMARDLAAYNAVVQANPPADRLQYVFRFNTALDVFHLSMEYSRVNGTVRFFGGKLDGNDGLSNGSSTLGAGYHTDAGYPVSGTAGNGFITLRAPLAAFGLAVGSRITGANAFAMAGPAETLEQTFFIPMRTVDASPPFDSTLGPQSQPPSNVGCDDENVQSEGGWSRMSDDRAKSGGFCRNVGSGKQNADESFQFTGTAIDLNVATGPRGGTLGFTVDGVRQAVNLYRAATGQPDNTGLHDLQFTKTVHVDVPAGTHSVRISNDSTDAYRDMVYVDGVVITGGDILTPVGHTIYEVGGTVIGTALAGTDTVMQVAIEPAMRAMDFVIQTTAGTTVKIVDPSGKTLASATVDDGGVLDLQAFPDGAGAYALVLHESATGDAAFTIWEKFAEAN